MLRDGYARKVRAIWNHPVVGMQDARRCLLWMWMIDLCYFNDADGLKRGQFRATVRDLADVVGMSKSAAQRFKDDLVREGMVTVEPGPTKRSPSTWTLVNYDRHQAGHSVGHMMGHERDTLRPVPIDIREPSRDTSGTRDGTLGGTPIEVKPSELKTQKETRARARVVSDETGIEWPEPSSTDFEYPESFKAMWADWQDASKVCLVTANGKLAAYKQIRRHLKTKTLTLAQLQDATANFLDKYRSNPTLFGAPQPPRFYGKQGEVFEYLESRKEADAKPTLRPMRKRWSAPYTAWSCCVTVCEEFDLPIPEKEGRARWEDVEKFHPLVIANASDDHQLRRPPEDLRQQVMQ